MKFIQVYEGDGVKDHSAYYVISWDHGEGQQYLMVKGRPGTTERKWTNDYRRALRFRTLEEARRCAEAVWPDGRARDPITKELYYGFKKCR